MGSYDHDIFISYAHLDNETPVPGQEGWVSQFHRALEVRVGQLLGAKPEVWRDPKLQGNDIFEDTLLGRMPSVGLLISVLTPRYVKSEWCQRELHEFCKASERTGGIRVKDKARVFKVVKTPTPPENHPPEMRPLLGYEFYRTDQETGRVRELDQVFGPEAQREFWARLDDLAHDVADLLPRLRSQEGRPVEEPAQPNGNGVAVYLAATTLDQQEAHHAMRRDLQRHGYTVLPDQSLPLVSSSLESTVREQLQRCRLSIHILGQNYGVVPEGTSQSIVAMQHELALERSANGADFARLVWIPRGLVTEDERQQELLQLLRTDVRSHTGGDLLETPLEDLKTVAHELLTRESKPQAATPNQETAAAQQIYLICDQRDRDAIGPLEAWLFEQGFEVTLPAFEGDEAEVREDHEENLRLCDAALIYYGAANDLWLRRKLRELRKSAAFGRAAPMRAKTILVAPPDSPQKSNLRTHEALILRPTGETFSPDALGPLVAALRTDPDASQGQTG